MPFFEYLCLDIRSSGSFKGHGCTLDMSYTFYLQIKIWSMDGRFLMISLELRNHVSDAQIWLVDQIMFFSSSDLALEYRFPIHVLLSRKVLFSNLADQIDDSVNQRTR